MTGQGESTRTVVAAELSSLEKHELDANRGQASQYHPTATGAGPVSWSAQGAENGSLPNLSYQHNHETTLHPENVVDVPNAASHDFTSSDTGVDNGSQGYTCYSSYATPTSSYGYTNTGYTGYYDGYQHQSSQPYSQTVGAYHSTGAPYQPLSSFQNTASYAGPTSYSTTYYNTGDYQTSAAYAGSSHSTSTNVWTQGSYPSYSLQYGYHNQASSSGYGHNSVAAATLSYEQQYKQWADYYNENEVICAPGTEKTSMTGSATLPSPSPTGVSSGFSAPASQSQPSYVSSWTPEPWSSGLPSVQTTTTAGSHDLYLKHRGQHFPNCLASTEHQNFQQTSDTKPAHPNVPEPHPNAYTNHGAQCFPNYLANTEYQNFQQTSDTKPAHPNLPHQHPNVYMKHGAICFPNYVANTEHQNFQQTSDTKPSSLPIVPGPQQGALPQGPSSQHPGAYQIPQTYQKPLHLPPPLPPPPTDTRGISKLQIPTNPRIASNLALGLMKTNKDSPATHAATKPAYVSVSFPMPKEKVLSGDASNSDLKPSTFPPSLRGYVERALGRCKNDKQIAASQEVLKEIITKATAENWLHTRDWDIEPLFPLPDTATENENLHGVASVSSKDQFKKSPGRRSKSRWEPLPVDKVLEKSAPAVQDTIKFGGWSYINGRDKKFEATKSEAKDFVTGKFSTLATAVASSERPPKRQRFGSDLNAVENGDASSDSDKEQSLTPYYSATMAMANSPEERKKRESRSKRFEKGNAQRTEINSSRTKATRPGNIYARRASALVITESLEDASSRAVEDIDWDALTVKGTSQELEKCYLRLTSAPDPSTVRPEEVLEKALLMVQISQKNYRYKCDQLKSIRQDLTVQRIQNDLTVRVYETHARLALEHGDLPEYNQCQSQLKSLYAEGIVGQHLEFSAYSLLQEILHSNSRRDLLASMSRLSIEAKRDEAVKHALAVRSAVTSGNYVLFFRLYRMAPNLNTCLMDLYVEKMRFEAVKCMSRAYRPTVPVSYIACALGFSSSPGVEGREKEVEGLEECADWLRKHGACITTVNDGEMQLDAKASASTLYMPEPEDAVAHGDANLAVNDFFTRATK